jgi:DNA invertase Pin-like site-specific DNA recombinase
MDQDRAAIYARISKDRTGAGVKVEDQVRDSRALAERLGLVVAEELIFSDNDLTAHRGKKVRRGYTALLASLRAGQVSAVVCTHADRLHRSVKELETYIDASGEVPTYQVMAGPLDLATASGKRNARLAAVIAEGEVDQMIERMRSARRHKAERGEWTGNKRPFGFEADGVTMIPAERDAVVWACGQVLSGMSMAATAKALNGREILTSSGRPWDSRTLGRMLLRPRNAGLSVHKGQVVGKAQWPALVDELTWRGVVAILSDPARRATPGGPPRWLLTNLGRCGAVIDGKECGNLVVSKSRGGKSKMIIYTCSAGAHLGRSAVEVDAYVREVVLAVLVERGRGLLVPEGADQHLAELHARDAILAGKLAELGRSFKADLIDLPTVESATAGIRAERAEITAELSAMARGSILSGVADAPDVAKAFDACDLSRRRAIVDLLMVVTIGRASRGRRVGWKPGGSYFDHTTITFEPK